MTSIQASPAARIHCQHSRII